MSQSILSQINVYPVKSMGGISLSNAWVEKQGLSFDRRFMIAELDGTMVTARKHPKLVTVRCALLADGVVFTAMEGKQLKITYQDFSMTLTNAQVWKDQFQAHQTTQEADLWFSELLEKEVQLLYTGEESQRVREKLGHSVSFADGYPLLIISEASLDELNRRSSETHSMAQFRTNLVVAGTEAFAEDSWKRIRIGEVEFEIVKPCERCVLTTVDVKQGEFRSNREPLKTLQSFRGNEKRRVFFGQNLKALNEGVIEQGAQIEVLEYQQAEQYIQR